MEKRYNREIQALCKSLSFGAAANSKLQETLQETVDKKPLEKIVDTAIDQAPLLSSMVFSVGPTNSNRSISFHLITMKLVAVLVILCRFAH